ncbi:MAG: ATP/GTP-binding protein [Gammaproteobacteria bacterium]|nr:ATP/GTP-binding protein [Gammaproteobacteria bacterium]
MFDKNAYKIIFTGPVGSGKSTAINSISDMAVISTEQIATDHVKNRKETTTVALDYGMIKLGEGENIHLYGTPGQERFNFMWEILVNNAIGIVILVDNANKDPLSDLSFFLKAFEKFIHTNAIAVGITRTDLSGGPSLPDYRRILKDFGLNPPLFEIDGRKKDEVSMLIQALLFSLDQSFHEDETTE